MLNERIAQSLQNKYSTEQRPPKELIAFRPQPRQIELIKAVGLWEWWNGGGMKSRQAPKSKLIGYGGAAFGGKTYGILGIAAMCAHAFPGCSMAFIRRTFSEMEAPGGVMDDAHNVFPLAGARARDGGKQWYWENGSKFRFRHCEHERDRYKYHGAQIDFLFADETTTFTWEIMDYILTRNRATTDNTIKSFAVLPSNPGNVGHSWYMQTFDLDRADGVPGMERWRGATEPREIHNPNDKPVSVFFIPAYLEDNKIGTDRDPEYEQTLAERHPDTYQALRYGNWEVFSGQAFREFSAEKHVIPPFDLYDDRVRRWPKWRAVDKGHYHPFFCLWFMRDPATGRVFIYRETGGSSYSDQEQAHSIALQTPATEHISISFGSPDFWLAKNMNGIIKTSAAEYAENGVPLIKGNPARVMGKQMVHNLLADGVDGKPRLQIFSTCVRLIDILPKLSRDDSNREDVKKQNGDDPYDTLKLGLTNIDIFKTEREPHDPKADYQVDEWAAIQNAI